MTTRTIVMRSQWWRGGHWQENGHTYGSNWTVLYSSHPTFNTLWHATPSYGPHVVSHPAPNTHTYHDTRERQWQNVCVVGKSSKKRQRRHVIHYGVARWWDVGWLVLGMKIQWSVCGETTTSPSLNIICHATIDVTQLIWFNPSFTNTNHSQFKHVIMWAVCVGPAEYNNIQITTIYIYIYIYIMRQILYNTIYILCGECCIILNE